VPERGNSPSLREGVAVGRGRVLSKAVRPLLVITESRVFIKKKEDLTRSKLWQSLNNMSKNV
jgi:hypothetical protein